MCRYVMKINFPFFSTNLILLFLMMLHLTAEPGYCTNTTDDISTLINEKHYLAQLLDSLDLQKQGLKRNGQPVIELEQRQAEVKDSLVLVRNHIRKATEIITPAPSGLRNGKSFFIKPRNLFDWIIVIVGIVAAFSGCMLFAGILRPLIFRKKSLNKKALTIQSDIQPSPTSAYPVYYNESRSVPVTDTETMYTSSNSDISALDQLRNRVSTPANDCSQPVTGRIPQALNTTLPTSDVLPNSPASIEQQILAAYRDGMDVAAISRKLHISSDHVALILKVAKKQHPCP